MSSSRKNIIIVGTGPAALMVADVVSSAGHDVRIYEKRKGAARKLLIAGSSGLNISNSLSHEAFIANYTGGPAFWDRVLRAFSVQDWLQWIHDLGLKTFLGTSRRYFVEDMKAASLSQAWIQRLKNRGVQFYFDHEFSNFSRGETGIQVQFTNRAESSCDALCLCLGGGSYEPQEKPLRWIRILEQKDLRIQPFQASNVGYQVAWSAEFLKEAEGLPLKNFVLKTKRGERKGECVITKYGIEGTPVYTLGVPGRAMLDLKPDLTEAEILSRLQGGKENFSPIRRVQKSLGLCPAAVALIFHHTPESIKSDLKRLIAHLKQLPIELIAPQSMDEAISTSGGLSLDEFEIDTLFMLKKYPGVFAAGEMLDWDAPTGGFLIQACVSQGHVCGESVLRYLQALG